MLKPSDIVVSYIEGALDNYLVNLMDDHKISKKVAVEMFLAPVILKKLRTYGAHIITESELDVISETIDTLELDSPVKQILHDYTNRIKQIM